MGMDGMKNKCAVGIYKIEKKNVDAIDQRERRMEKMRLLLIHVVLLSVLLVGGRMPKSFTKMIVILQKYQRYKLIRFPIKQELMM